MSKFEKDAKLLTEYIGGKENVAAVTHCATRMRFVLNDTSKADVEKIKVEIYKPFVDENGKDYFHDPRETILYSKEINLE